jgi:uncharacterized protein YndB with AHSA1/START domain
MTNNTVITKDVTGRKLHVTHEFAASPDKVWRAWTEAELLDKWWAPKPWKAETKAMNFNEGGQWLYAMAGPDGERHWSRVDFKTIKPGHSFSYTCKFCDENGNVNDSSPAMHWFNTFHPTETGTRVDTEISFDREVDMETIIKMGFEGGFTMGLGNLDELLAKES